MAIWHFLRRGVCSKAGERTTRKTPRTASTVVTSPGARHVVNQ
jgi:hypothetical protein